mmetsp:Transcript_40327/g.63810  ORF Transcript_40327/g.63810 Transcript_40327/m.63810 type:complete len:313 (-) Transcript_40327:12-950(-)
MTGIVTNADGCYLLDLSVALASSGEKPLDTVDELIEFVAGYLHELGIFDSLQTLQQITASGAARYRDVELALGMSILLIPKELDGEVYLSFPNVLSGHVFLKELHCAPFVRKSVENPRTPVPVIIGCVSKKIPDEENYQWTAYVRLPFSLPSTEKFIEKVVFDLHESFDPCQQEVVAPGPFEVSHTGWGEFAIGFVVRFSHGGFFRTSHQLQLFLRTTGTATPEVISQDSTEETPEIRNECLKTVEIESNLLSDEVQQAVQEYYDNCDTSVENEQNARLEALCQMVQEDIDREKKVLSKLQQDELLKVVPTE